MSKNLFLSILNLEKKKKKKKRIILFSKSLLSLRILTKSRDSCGFKKKKYYNRAITLR